MGCEALGGTTRVHIPMPKTKLLKKFLSAIDTGYRSIAHGVTLDIWRANVELYKFWKKLNFDKVLTFLKPLLVAIFVSHNRPLTLAYLLL